MASISLVNAHTRRPCPPGQDLVVISTELEGYRFLAQNAAPQAEVLLLSPRRDGVATILQMLMALPSIRRIHLATPGEAEGLQLGNVLLRHNTIPNYASTLCQWRSQLSPNSEILIYNYQAARTESGKLLIDILHYLTGAAIAACTTLPNATFPQGIWEVDCATRQFMPHFAISPATVAACFSQTNVPDANGVAAPLTIGAVQ
jgi:hypothetical protein